ncbi:MAG: DUF1992 domain-containing protein [Zetaproteobacteria bacterium]|nr:MAG: DUF1992 domain-containing protein [Zetaproteobacteria bacterium]
MNIVAWIAERKIEEAMQKGAFDNLEGMGKPLRLDDDPVMPEELRTAYRVLKNAGFLPPEVELRREIHSLAELLACVQDASVREAKSRRLRALLFRLQTMRPDRPPMLDEAYLEQIAKRLG